VVVVIDEPPPGVRPGLSATAKITTATRKDAIAVPIQAVTTRMRRELEAKADDGKGASTLTASPKEKDEGKEELQGVFVVRSGIATFAPIDIGIMSATDMEIVKGVQPGDTIVTGSFSVLRSLKNKAKVRIDNAPAAPSSSGS
jgi:HlyD family secretion protein